MKVKKKALISVFNKEGISNFAKALVEEFNYELLSTGGTGSILQKYGIPFTQISSYTNSPEMFDGRVKTLHPKIEGGILFRREHKDDLLDAAKYDISPIDMVVCNLYDFKEAILKPGVNLESALEMIDIGGPTMIRAAAKNFNDVVVVSNPQQYDKVLEELRRYSEVQLETKRDFAKEVFFLMAKYNALIANYLSNYQGSPSIMDEVLVKEYQKVSDTRYGENWDQAAAYYRDNSQRYGLHNLTKIHGKKISYNNYLDIDTCMRMLLEFGEENYVTLILKHSTPNGVAISKKNQLESVQYALNTDPISAFGGVWGLNKEFTGQSADYIINQKKIFVEAILAPSFSMEALDVLKQKQNLIILEYVDFLHKKEEIYKSHELKSVLGGILAQEYDYKPVIKEWNVVSKLKASEKDKEALIFSYIVSKWAKSNSACFCQLKNDVFYTIGIGSGQQSRVHVVKLAIQKAIELGHRSDLKDSYMGTDSFFPFPDGLEAACKAGAKAIINPGGSMRDNEVIKRADEIGCILVFCGKRVFRH